MHRRIRSRFAITTSFGFDVSVEEFFWPLLHWSALLYYEQMHGLTCYVVI